MLDALPGHLASQLASVRHEILDGVESISWPPDAGSFSLNPIPKKNGVTPIKHSFAEHLVDKGWGLEVVLEGARIPGPVDGFKHVGDLRVCIEWETGNVASSYRALLKMMKALTLNEIDAGFLVISSKDFARYLTDRIGTDEEIYWTFEMLPLLFSWGHIEIIVMEPDAYDSRVPLIPKQACGNGLLLALRNIPDDGQATLFAAAGIPEGKGRRPKRNQLVTGSYESIGSIGPNSLANESRPP